MTTTHKVSPAGTLALPYLQAEVEHRTACAESYCAADRAEADSALADLRALMARAEAAEADNARLRAALETAEAACDQAAAFLSDEPCTGAWATAHAESLSGVAMEARAVLSASGSSSASPAGERGGAL